MNENTKLLKKDSSRKSVTGSGVTGGSNSSSLTVASGWRTMRHIESDQRRHRMFAFGLFLLFMTVVISIMAGRVKYYHRLYSSANNMNTDDDTYFYTNEINDDDLFYNTYISSSNVKPTKEDTNSMTVAQQSLQKLNDNYKTLKKDKLKNKNIDVAQDGCESTLMIFRHCEKDLNEGDDDDDFTSGAKGSSNPNPSIRHCTAEGYQRSQYLATLFGGNNGTTHSRWPKPSKLYALTLHRSDHANFREYETLRPLSVASSTPIDLSTRRLISTDYFALLNSGQLCGKLTLICWKHSRIPELASKMGCDVNNGCPDHYSQYTFDEVWQLKFVLNAPIMHYPAEVEVVTEMMGHHRYANVINDNNITNTEYETSTAESTGSIGTDGDDQTEISLPELDTVTDSSSSSSTTTTENGEKVQQPPLLKKSHNQKQQDGSNEKQDDNNDDDNVISGWSVYGYVAYQNFDPVEWAKNGGSGSSGGAHL